MKKFEYLNILNSPFKPFRLKFYLGKIKFGTPIFFPRRWVPVTKEEAKKEANKRFDRLLERTDKEPKLSIWKGFYETSLKSKKAVPKKFGFDFVSLGYKYKWDEPRFEWSPMFSFVFWEWQFVINVSAPCESDHYWESWIYYHNETDKNLSKRERIEITKKQLPQTWTTSYGNGKKETINYYEKFLKKKYL